MNHRPQPLPQPLLPPQRHPSHRAARALCVLAALALHAGLLGAVAGAWQALAVSQTSPARQAAMSTKRTSVAPGRGTLPLINTSTPSRTRAAPGARQVPIDRAAPAAATSPTPSPADARPPNPPAPAAQAVAELQPSPDPVQLDYLAERGPWRGEAHLHWTPLADQRYQADWQLTLGQWATQDWHSEGRWGAEGLQPERMVERRKGRDRTAVNFQRDKGIISFSGPRGVLPLPSGVQDRVTWLWQLPLLAQAAGSRLQAGGSLALSVVTVRGELQDWLFEVQGQDLLPANEAGSRSITWHLVREPLRPYDSRIDIWLDPAQAWVPVQLRFTQLPGDEEQALFLKLQNRPLEPTM